ncbi:polymerase delta-interacting protein 3 [Astyanax mexicanus]|uniref:polymerase delta-interacting protein 3 n=1 Tax=Astyanax mexicanus TaxID=7994 RepID=UPI0020CB6302|nr:polymerase delta-interacting protein 3 [Astyanax mexicanus]
MADVSLDEVIRRRFTKRPVFGRGAGIMGRGAGLAGRGPGLAGRGAGLAGRGAGLAGRGGGLASRGAGMVGRTFDARQKIGTSDVRQRLGGGAGFQVKDARERLGQKDARFRIRGRGGSVNSVQDARQTINSRKQQPTDAPAASGHTPIPHIHIQNTTPVINTVRAFPTNQGLNSRVGVAIQPGGGLTKMVDARDRLSLKRNISSPNQGPAPPLKITKTIQQRPVGMTSGIRINVHGRTPQGLSVAAAAAVDDDDGDIPNKQMKITAPNVLTQTRVGPGPSFSMSTPITKVVKNDSYTAPPPPAPVAVAPTRPSARPPTQNLQPVSRTMVTGQAASGNGSSLTPPQPVFSPLEGTKITVNNLHPRVTEEDIVELFCVCGALKRARLVKVGVAEVVFVRKDDAISAYRKYNNRCLDGQPMKCNLHIQGNVITSDQPILLRLSDSPAGGASTSSSSSSSSSKKEGLPAVLSRPRSSSAQAEVDPQTILKALFKSSNQSTATTEPATAQPTAFRIKI